MTKVDLRKQYALLYKASAKEPAVVQVPRLAFLMANGQGDPQAEEFQQAVGALYGLSYTLKFGLKKRGGPDFTVMALEGLWWADGACPGEAFIKDLRDQWKWTLLILQPDFIGQTDVEAAREELRAKGKGSAALDRTRLESFEEGPCVQVMHIGPYATEAGTIERLHAFAREKGYALRGKHHEIYLGDPRRSAPEKLKTILRHPVTQP
jgi:hypothetical protein